MMKPELLDVVELLADLPEQGLRAGNRGAIVECYADHAYEVEFTDSEGETLALMALDPSQFIVVWKANTTTWVSAAEQIASLVARLTDETRQEVLDFTRFLYERRLSPK
jgi:triphosphoribosyl-dephospho-CoA synthetase